MDHRAARLFRTASGGQGTALIRCLRTASAAVAVTILACLLVAIPVTGTAVAATTKCTGTHWIATWATAPSHDTTLGSPDVSPALVAGRQTFRMMVTPHRSGTRVRVHMTNRFGNGPMTFEHVTVALKADGASVAPGSVRDVTFGGSRAVTVQPGKDAVSDPVKLRTRAFHRVAISYYVPQLTVLPTEHFNANQTSYYTLPNGRDLSRSESGSAFALKTTSWHWVSGLDVKAPARARTLVAFGDSITDGFVGLSPAPLPASSVQVDKNVRYPDFLQRRLATAGIPLVTVDEGIAGNRLLEPGLVPQFGPSATSRIVRDGADVPGATNAIILVGINDLGEPPSPSVAHMERGYTSLIKVLHAKHIHVLLGTIMPSGNAILDGPSTAPGLEQKRQRINAWIRAQHVSDGIVDFDKAMRSPTDPSVLNPAYASGDDLHPNPRGYRAMANAVPLTSLETGCR